MAFFVHAMNPRFLKLSACVALAFGLAACAGLPSYRGIEVAMVDGDYDQAARKVEKASGAYSGRSRLVYYMDRLITAHLAGQYHASNLYAEKSHRLIDALYTRSLSGEAMSWVLNDGSKDYRGEHFEQILVHLFSLLNYGMLGDPEEALVEARRADLKFREHNRRFEGKVAYSEDAAMRWLSGLMYEALGEPGEALVDYRKSVKAFTHYRQQFGMKVPRQALADLLRLAGRMGEKEIARQVRKDFPAYEAPDRQDGEADLVALVYEGMAPRKVSDYWQLPVGSGKEALQIFHVAYPRFVASPPVLKAAFVETDQGQGYPLELFEDIQAIAIADLADRMLRIQAKAIARATAKYQAAREIQEHQDSVGKKALAVLLTNLFAIASEQADVRSWRTLPGRIHIARLRLPEGKKDFSLRLLRHDGGESVHHFSSVPLKSGIPAFIRASLY